MLKLIDTLSELTTNIREYQKAVELSHASHRRRGRVIPSLVRAWYYVPALDLVAASCFIGYKGMNLEHYQQNEEIDGKVTEPHLQRKGWFRPIKNDEPHYGYVRSLAESLSSTGKLYPSARFYVLKNKYDEQVRRAIQAEEAAFL